MSDISTPIGHLAAKTKEHIDQAIPDEVAKQIDALPIPADGQDGLGLNVKSWDEGIHREGVLVQHNIGQVFKALRDTNLEPGVGEDWERIGTNGFRWTGVKNAEFPYQDGDLYIDGGTTFMWFGGKGYMFAQRGKNGKDGVDGKAGSDGRDAPKVLEIRWDNKGIAFAYDNGDLIEADVPGLEAMQKRLSWLEEQFTQDEDIDAPIKAYKGHWKAGDSYAKGDTVTFTKGFYLCIEADSSSDGLDPDKWIKLAGAGGGGGGAGGGGGISRVSTLLVDTLLNMGGLRIQGVGDPRTGVIGKADAVNKDTMEKAIAAGALYQGIYTVATNNPDLSTKADVGFTPPATGSTVAKPNAAASDVSDPLNILTWHNWGGNGFDTFAVTTTVPTAFEVRLSD